MIQFREKVFSILGFAGKALATASNVSMVKGAIDMPKQLKQNQMLADQASRDISRQIAANNRNVEKAIKSGNPVNITTPTPMQPQQTTYSITLKAYETSFPCCFAADACYGGIGPAGPGAWYGHCFPRD